MLKNGQISRVRLHTNHDVGYPVSLAESVRSSRNFWKASLKAAAMMPVGIAMIAIDVIATTLAHSLPTAFAPNKLSAMA